MIFTKARSTKYYNNDRNDNGNSKDNARPHELNLHKQDRPSITTTTTTTMETTRTTEGHTNRNYESLIEQALQQRPRTTMETAGTTQSHTNRIHESKIDQVLQKRPQRQWQQEEHRKATRMEFTKARSTQYYNDDHIDNGNSKNSARPHE